jgi:hypothetical protein
MSRRFFLTTSTGAFGTASRVASAAVSHEVVPKGLEKQLQWRIHPGPPVIHALWSGSARAKLQKCSFALPLPSMPLWPRGEVAVGGGAKDDAAVQELAWGEEDPKQAAACEKGTPPWPTGEAAGRRTGCGGGAGGGSAHWLGRRPTGASAGEAVGGPTHRLGRRPADRRISWGGGRRTGACGGGGGRRTGGGGSRLAHQRGRRGRRRAYGVNGQGLPVRKRGKE